MQYTNRGIHRGFESVQRYRMKKRTLEVATTNYILHSSNNLNKNRFWIVMVSENIIAPIIGQTFEISSHQTIDIPAHVN